MLMLMLMLMLAGAEVVLGAGLMVVAGARLLLALLVLVGPAWIVLRPPRLLPLPPALVTQLLLPRGVRSPGAADHLPSRLCACAAAR